MKKVVMTSVALTTLLASPALAAPRHQARVPAYEASNGGVTAGQAAYDPYAVVFSNRIVGRDPDPNIRLQLLRDGGVSEN